MLPIELVGVQDAIPYTCDTLLLALQGAPECVQCFLTPEEWAALQRQYAREVFQFCFPRPDHTLWIKLVKKETQADTCVQAAATQWEQWRLAGNAFIRELEQHKTERVALRDLTAAGVLTHFVEGMLLGSYQFLRHFSKNEDKKYRLQQIAFLDHAIKADELNELRGLAEAVFLTRDLVNEPFSHLNTQQLVEAAHQTGKQYGFEVTTLNKQAIVDEGMGGLLSVSRASTSDPAFCVLTWNGTNDPATKPLVLVGKGVVYDTGGLSLKTSDGMEYMKCDMAGAAVVIGILAAAARNRLPVHLIGLLPITDNLVGQHAFAPGDVIRMASGTTVEVANTDAEGRLILADALHYAKRYEPALVADIATLTGSAVRALGSQAICYMGTAPQSIKEALECSGWNTYERLVELPLWKEYGEELKSQVADLRNIGQGGNAGMITAGKFLEHFTNYPWVHLDIAGPAYIRAANGYRTKEGTGVGVRLFYHFLKAYSAQQSGQSA